MDKVTILEDLDFYLHQIDNARDFVALRGMESVIKNALGSENALIREKAAILFGATVQSNPDVQDRVLAQGWMKHLVDQVTNSGEVISVRTRLVAAISNLVRGSSGALKEFRREAGFKKYLAILEELAASNQHNKLRLKILGFLADVAVVSEGGEDDLLASKTVLHQMVSDTVKELPKDTLDDIEKVSEILDSFVDYYDTVSYTHLTLPTILLV